MRIPKREASGSLTFNLTPMIDVVFLLIIFFILASHFSRQEIQMELKLPAAETGQPGLETEGRRVLVNVLPEGQILLGAVPVSVAELPERIAQASRQTGGELEVRIRSDRTVPYRVVEPILVSCAKAGVWKVSFAVVNRPGKE